MAGKPPRGGRGSRSGGKSKRTSSRSDAPSRGGKGKSAPRSERGKPKRKSDSSRQRAEPSRRPPRTPRPPKRDDDDKSLFVSGILKKRSGTAWVDPNSGGPAILMSPIPDAPEGQLVTVQVDVPATDVQSSVGHVIEVHGDASKRSVLLGMEARSLGLPVAFPSAAVSEAEAAAKNRPEHALEEGGRRDLREVVHVTIDGEDAKDFDDAISVTPDANGFRVWVSIADVSHYVTEGGALDREALRRGCSVYFPTEVFPMLPEVLSNDMCSLRPEVERCAVTCEMVVTASGERRDVSIYPSVIRSAARLTYTQVDTVLQGEDTLAPRLNSLVRDANSCAQTLRAYRALAGGLDLDLPEPRFEFDAQGEPVNVASRSRLSAHRLIEDLMLAANESVAEWLSKRKLAAVYRVHPSPPPEAWEELATWGKRYGLRLKISDPRNPMALREFLGALSESPVASIGQMRVLRTLTQAYYAHTLGMHFGLASQAYAHFTSPIRRYPDLVVHRALKRAWASKPPLQDTEQVAAHCSERERKAVEAERAVDQYAACMVASDHVGKEMLGVVVGIHHAGAFVRIEQPFVEGMIPVASLGAKTGEFFEVWEEQQALVSRTTNTRLDLGDRVQVRLNRVDLELRRIDFEYLGPDPDKEDERLPRAPNARKPNRRRKKGDRGESSRSPKSKGRRRGPKSSK